MIQPIQVRFVTVAPGCESIEIASGDFLGHTVGTLIYDSEHQFPWNANGVRFLSFAAALHEVMATTYRYVGQQLDANTSI